jgi:hypothetical protein
MASADTKKDQAIKAVRDLFNDKSVSWTTMRRLFGVRHLRWMWHSFHAHRLLNECRRAGLGFFLQPSDEQYLQDIWDGKE